MNITTHFTMAEATNSSTALRMGIANEPPQQQNINIGIAADGMERVRAALGGLPLHIDSWYRCEALERVLCVADYTAWCAHHGQRVDDQSWAMYFSRKAHPKGYAVDFTCPDFGAPEEVVAALKASGIRFDQCICEGTWVHVSFDPLMRGQFLVATFTNGTPTYSEA